MVFCSSDHSSMPDMSMSPFGVALCAGAIQQRITTEQHAICSLYGTPVFSAFLTLQCLQAEVPAVGR